MPFARELLIRGTKVIFCANQEPSINDITLTELKTVLKRCCQDCTIIQKAYNLEQLLVFCSGQTSVCLDLRNITTGNSIFTVAFIDTTLKCPSLFFLRIELADAIETHQVDLLIIEGMARALHTNLNAKFKVETLKLVVVKNKWWANRLGGDTFSVICKYEPARTTSAILAWLFITFNIDFIVFVSDSNSLFIMIVYKNTSWLLFY